MRSQTVEAAELFPLSVVSHVLKNYSPPAAPFDPDGAWTHRYGVHTIGQRGSGRVGDLILEQKTVSEEEAVLRIDYRKKFPGNTIGHVEAEVRAKLDDFATPVNWRLKTETLGANGDPMPNTRYEQSARSHAGAVEIRDGDATHEIPLTGDYTINWLLFAAVQRLPRHPFRSLLFTLLDDFDQVKPGQTLSWRGEIDVALGAAGGGEAPPKTLQLYTYEQLGPGVVPWVYHVDAAGRLLFAVSGIEAYILESTGAGKGASK